jgi:phenylalanyl-tRNA synthetase alpha chain
MTDSYIPKYILNKLNSTLDKQTNHPICHVKHKILEFFDSQNKPRYDYFDNQNPLVSIEDTLSKIYTDNGVDCAYYDCDTMMLNTHLSSHIDSILKEGFNNFVICDKVYRKDCIDPYHYPVFHQIEYVDKKPNMDQIIFVNNLMSYIVPNCNYRVTKNYNSTVEDILFSFQVHTKIKNKNIKLIEGQVFRNNCWRFNIGLERIAMVKYDIPDIRYFWTDNRNFLHQFIGHKDHKFIHYVKSYPIERFLKLKIEYGEAFDENNMLEYLRFASKDSISDVTECSSNEYFKVYKITYYPIENINMSAYIQNIDYVHQNLEMFSPY